MCGLKPDKEHVDAEWQPFEAGYYDVLLCTYPNVRFRAIPALQYFTINTSLS